MAYREAVARSPYTPAFWWNLAAIESQFAKQNDAGAREAAISAMRSAIAASPANPESYDRLARIQYSFGEYAQAVESEKSAISLLAREPKYYSQASEAARQLKDTTAAVDFLKQGVAATDSNDLRLTLAVRLVEASRGGRSIATARSRAVIRRSAVVKVAFL